MKFSRPLAAVFCALLSLSANAQVSPKDSWIRLKTPSFTVIGNTSEKELRVVATKLEQFRAAFSSIFPTARLSSSVPTNVVVFKNSSSYDPYRPKRADGKADKFIAGYFQAGEDVNYITLSTEGEPHETYGTIFHEYVHALLNTSFGKSTVPPWFNEGLAEFYQTFEIQDDQKVSLGKLQDGHLLLLQRSDLIPLKQFFEIDNRSLHQNGNHSRSIFYAQAWALMHYLIQGNGGTNVEALGKFIGQIMKDVAPETAFRSAFGMDYLTMEKALRKYVEQRNFRGSLITFQNKLVFDDKFVLTPVPEALANAYLGDLLYQTQEYAPAEAHLQRAVLLDPALSMAHTSLGLLKMRQRNFQDARKYLEKAIAEDARNHLAYYSYAYALSREGMDEFGFVSGYSTEMTGKMLAALKRSIELNPQFPESYRLLAFVQLIGGEDLDSALAAIRKGMALQPGSQQYPLMLAQIYMRQEKYDEAKVIVQKIAKTADDEQLRAMATKILGTIDQFLDARLASQKQMDEIRAGKLTGGRPAIIVKRESMTDDEFTKLERDRELRNLNQVIAKPEVGEKQIVGNIEKVECVSGEIIYSVKTAAGPLTLTSKDFQSLRMEILHDGTKNMSVGCDADLKGDLVSMIYRPGDPSTPRSRNVLTSLSFVPADFRLMDPAEMQKEYVIIQGGPPTDTAKNAETAAAEIEEMERKRRDSMMNQIQNAVRKPQPGEIRVIGVLARIECSGKAAFYNIESGGGVLRLKVPEDHNKITIMAFTQDAAGAQFQCGTSLPNVSAIITYMPGNEKKSAGELVAVEFVPKSFVLPAN